MRKLRWVLASAILAGCSLNSDTEVDNLFKDYRAAGKPGASVMVIKEGDPVLIRTYGLASLEGQEPVRTFTNFRLASVTKQFTATAVLMLVAEGKLALDESIRQYFPEFPAFTGEITIRQLLQHTSGIEDYEPIYGDAYPEQILDRGVVEIISLTEGTYFPPGTEYRYSNSGYAILAILVEDVSGQSFPKFLNQRIFAPLGMVNTVAYRRGENDVPNRALGYTVDGDLVEETDQSAWSAVVGDGGIYSSLEDLFLWDQALYDNDLLPAELWAAAWTPGKEDYGFGWRIDDYKGHRRLHHSGSTSGFRNFMQRFPEEELTVIVLTNRAGPDVAPLAEQIADRYLVDAPSAGGP